jgi:O-acetyl-ADP-ribose deacetylase (regulator of RNase III)
MIGGFLKSDQAKIKDWWLLSRKNMGQITVVQADIFKLDVCLVVSEAALLASSYEQILERAVEKQCKSIAFSAAACDDLLLAENAAEIAINTCSVFLEERSFLQKIVLCCATPSVFQVYQKTLNRLSCTY